jgi:prepilin-type N-terminal cleavage/methylation domain-containing protein
MRGVCRYGFSLIELLVIVFILGLLAAILLPVFAQACGYYEASLAIYRELGHKGGPAGNLNNLALVHRELREWETARALEAESERLWMEYGSVEGKVGVLLTQREAYGYRLDGDERHERDHLVAAIRQEYDKPLFNAAWEEGRAMRAEQAMEYALEATGVTVQRVFSQSKDGMAPQEAL